MSISPPTTTTSSTAVNHHTYWCHECDMSVLLQPHPSTTTTTTFPLLCPHCRHDFLEQMDSFTPPPPNSTIPSFSNPSSPFFYPFPPLNPPTTTATTSFPLPTTARSDDNFLLDSPYLHRLIHHLMTTPHYPTTTTTTTTTNPTRPHYNSPASKSAIESLDRIAIDSGFLQKDPTIVCPVCKDQFVLNSEAKMLPCKHIYHSECIVPWLEMNNSCPVCRYRLQSHDEIEIQVEGGENFLGPPQLDELLDDEEDLFGFRDTLRNVVRRHQFNSSNTDNNGDGTDWRRSAEVENEFLFSPSQIGEAEGGSGRIGNNHVERADSVETVSSWPTWPVEGGGGGDVDIGLSSSSRGCEDVDTVKS